MTGSGFLEFTSSSLHLHDASHDSPLSDASASFTKCTAEEVSSCSIHDAQEKNLHTTRNTAMSPLLDTSPSHLGPTSEQLNEVRINTLGIMLSNVEGIKLSFLMPSFRQSNPRSCSGCMSFVTIPGTHQVLRNVLIS